MYFPQPLKYDIDSTLFYPLRAYLVRFRRLFWMTSSFHCYTCTETVVLYLQVSAYLFDFNTPQEQFFRTIFNFVLLTPRLF